MNDICPICLDTSTPMNFILLCNHQYHSTCINQWLNISCICPYCRTYVKTYFKASLNKYCPLNVDIHIHDNYLNIIFFKNIEQRIYYNKIKYLRILDNDRMIKLSFFKENGTVRHRQFFIKPSKQASFFYNILRNKIFKYAEQMHI
jgi:hypothetical protein